MQDLFPLDVELIMHNHAFTMHNYSKSKIQVAVVGGSGYSGQELQRLLNKHPFAQVKGIFNSQTATQMNPADFQVVFLATPAEVSAELAPKILEHGVSVIDLSGAYRLNNGEILKTYEQWYGMAHPSVKLFDQAQYGLVPWMKPKIDGPVLIANPGCYASAILMGLLPLLKDNLIKADSIVIDAKSGTTGAGKKAVESQLFSEVDGECLPYKVGVHQHLPEVKLFSQIIGDYNIDPFFTTSLIPTRRGIIAGIYAKLNHGKHLNDVLHAFKDHYADYPLVEISAEVSRDMVSLKKVVGTASTHISFTVIDEKLYLFSCLDNLLKGAASQAIENFNLIHHLPVTTGLEHLEAII
jgi:N-acetyl-gamma-glutamyl-phosphate reductase